MLQIQKQDGQFLSTFSGNVISFLHVFIYKVSVLKQSS